MGQRVHTKADTRWTLSLGWCSVLLFLQLIPVNRSSAVTPEDRLPRAIQLGVDDLLACQGTDGGWAYNRDQPGVAEPTAYAVLVCHRVGLAKPRDRGLEFIASLSRDAGFGSRSLDSHPGWMTAPVVFALGQVRGPDDPLVTGAVRWLLDDFNALSAPGKTAPGWPWVNETASWVEPTAFTVQALTAVGRGREPRVLQAIDMLLDRGNEEGGFSLYAYRPFLYHTAVVLLALQDHPDVLHRPACAKALEFLARRGTESSGTLGMAYGLWAASLYGLPIAETLADNVMKSLERSHGHAGSLDLAIGVLGLLAFKGRDS